MPLCFLSAYVLTCKNLTRFHVTTKFIFSGPFIEFWLWKQVENKSLKYSETLSKTFQYCLNINSSTKS